MNILPSPGSAPPNSPKTFTHRRFNYRCLRLGLVFFLCALAFRPNRSSIELAAFDGERVTKTPLSLSHDAYLYSSSQVTQRGWGSSQYKLLQWSHVVCAETCDVRNPPCETLILLELQHNCINKNIGRHSVEGNGLFAECAGWVTWASRGQ
jgi:hypothetical protein